MKNGLNFIAIDFETATPKRASICEVGICVVRNGEVVETRSWLVQPKENLYSYWNMQCHGIRPEDTEHSPSFPEVWKEIDPIIAGLPLVAHNSPFDEGCLRSVFKTYEMEYPEYPFYCTLKASRKLQPELPNHRLDTVAETCNFNLTNHHNAIADAEACAAIALKLL